jgi:cytochrome b involved in lipid metabolism
MEKSQKKYTLEEVALHNKKKDRWVVVRGKVYDVTNFDDHPGGIEALITNAGTDATEVFNKAGHDADMVDEMNSKYLIGELEEGVKQREVKKEIRKITMEYL